MGTVGARCMSGCEGSGKKEMGEKNLEDIKLPLSTATVKKEKDYVSEETKNIYKARSSNINKYIEENERK